MAHCGTSGRWRIGAAIACAGILAGGTGGYASAAAGAVPGCTTAQPASRPAGTSQPASSPAASTQPAWPPGPVGWLGFIIEEAGQDNGVELPGGSWVGWDRGIAYRAPGKTFNVRMGIRSQTDFGWVHGPDLEREAGLTLEDRSLCRRCRPHLSGDVGDWLSFKFEIGLEAPVDRLHDVYVRVKKVPYVGNVTVGRFSEPMGLDQLTSNAWTTFVERGLSDILVPSTNNGVMVQNTLLDQRMTWAAGVFKAVRGDRTIFGDEDFHCGSSDLGDALSYTGRLTAMGWYKDKGRDLLHLGASYSYRDPSEPIRHRARPEAYVAPYFTDTGSIDAQGEQLAGLEAAIVRGPFSAQAEWTTSIIDPVDGGQTALDGAYVQASYFLTGESRNYDRAIGAFSTVKPRRNFLSRDGGLGAWEIAMRYSYLDLDGPGLSTAARAIQDVTVGLNWYLSVNLRVSWNYVRSWVDGQGVSADADLFVMRVQVSF